jgi:hypothetical protein
MPVAALLLACAAVARAASPLDGLEMDVIDPGQQPVVPTARIALPRAPGAGPAVIDGIEDALADSALRGAPAAAEAGNREDTSVAPTDVSK